MGYDPYVCYTGRSPLEAASIGVDLKDTDVALRCNIVTLSDEENYADKTMVDYCAGDISTEEAAKLIETIDKELGNDIYKFYAGVAYRHCLVVDNGTTDLGTMTPPHDISGRVVGEYLSKSENAAPLIELMKKSYDILKDHPVNLDRKARGLKPANSIWLWSPGKKPQLPSFKEKWGLNASVISAVDLIKGIGLCAEMNSIDVEGATGNVHTNYDGKANAAIDAFKNGADLVYVHVEAPDECGHRAELENKVLAVELIDKKILKPVYEYLKSTDEDFKIMVLPDHPTPIRLRTHTMTPVPFFIYSSKDDGKKNDIENFNEDTCVAANNYISNGYTLMDILVKG
jgi:2,3-bisphosphoglycerate-independent phosphoglycerate mutase